MTTPDCLLKKVEDGDNEFTAAAGMLSLVLTDVTGKTQIDTIDTSVFDISNPDAPVSVTFSATTRSLSLMLESGKRYFISFTFTQLTAPFTSRAVLKEACGQPIGIVTVTRLYPAYLLEVA